jgi:hypothetical protein
MATTSHAPSPVLDAPVEDGPVSLEDRKLAFADALVVKDRLGYEVESQGDFEAVIFTPSPRRWLGTRAGKENQRLIMTMNDTCQMTMRRR